MRAAKKLAQLFGGRHRHVSTWSGRSCPCQSAPGVRPGGNRPLPIGVPAAIDHLPAFGSDARSARPASRQASGHEARESIFEYAPHLGATLFRARACISKYSAGFRGERASAERHVLSRPSAAPRRRVCRTCRRRGPTNRCTRLLRGTLDLQSAPATPVVLSRVPDPAAVSHRTAGRRGRETPGKNEGSASHRPQGAERRSPS
jgi:hypothetical protein